MFAVLESWQILFMNGADMDCQQDYVSMHEGQFPGPNSQQCSVC